MFGRGPQGPGDAPPLASFCGFKSRTLMFFGGFLVFLFVAMFIPLSCYSLFVLSVLPNSNWRPIAFGSPCHSRSKGSVTEIGLTPRRSFAQADFVNVVECTHVLRACC